MWQNLIYCWYRYNYITYAWNINSKKYLLIFNFLKISFNSNITTEIALDQAMALVRNLNFALQMHGILFCRVDKGEQSEEK